MATHDYIISNASGAAVRADLNNALAAIATNNSSATAPTTTYAYQWWADTGSSPTVMKLRNAANSAWITLFQLDGEWSLIPFENGTAAAPSIYFKDSGTDTGFYSPGVDQVGITTGGAVRLTTSTTAFTGTLPWQGQNGTAAAPALSFSGDPNTGVYNVGADNIGVSTNGTLRFDVSTTATTSTLPVVHPLGAVATPSITFTGDLNTGIWSPAADTIAVSTNGAERSRVDSSGRLLVGTTSARGIGTSINFLTQIEGVASGTTYPGLSVTNNSNDAESSYIVLGKSRGTAVGSNTVVQVNDVVGRILFAAADGTDLESRVATIEAQIDGTPGANDTPGRLVFSTTVDGASTVTERCRIDSSGRLLVGTTTAPTVGGWNQYARIVNQGNTAGATNAGVLALNRGIAAASMVVDQQLGVITFGDSTGNEFATIICQADAAPGTNDYPGRLVFNTTADGASSPTERMRISNNGVIEAIGIYNFTTANAANVAVLSAGQLYRSTSSSKYKTEIETLQDSYADALLDCRPVWYRSTCESDCAEHSWWGFIAEEVAEIDPRLVHWKTVEVTYDEKGSPVQTPCDPEPEGVAYDRFVPHLLNLIKRQQQAIETLEAKVAALEAN